MKKVFLTLVIILGLTSHSWIIPFSHATILEDETSYTSMRGSFVDGQAWWDG